VAVDHNNQAALYRQQQILDDIRQRTGRSYVKIGAIDTSKASTAAAVLPVLADWVDITLESNVRSAIYGRFGTKHANAYIDRMLHWARREEDKLGRNSLIAAISHAILPKDARRVWSQLQGERISELDMMLVAKLSAFPAVAIDVKNHIAALLASGSAGVSDLQYIAKVKDDRVEAWFVSRLESVNASVRKLARRVANSSKEMGGRLTYDPRGPDRHVALFSAEVDADQVGRILEQIKSEYRATMPSQLSSVDDFLSRARLGRWIRCQLAAERGVLSAWLRLEDIDIVEIVITPSPE
jgi:hypothetical protein